MINLKKELIFLGTGTSEGVPRVSCLTNDKNCDFEFDTLENLSKLGQVMMFKHNGNWECMDHERDVVYMNKLLTDNKAFWKVW